MSSVFSEVITPGIIVERHDHSISVVPVSECADKKQCAVGCGACGGKKNSKKITVDVSAPEQFTIGTSITVRHYTINEFIGALIVFGIPLFTACLTLFIWYLLSPASIESGKAMGAAGAAFIAGFGVVRIVDTWFRNRFPSEVFSVPESDVSPVFNDRVLLNG